MGKGHEKTEREKQIINEGTGLMYSLSLTYAPLEDPDMQRVRDLLAIDTPFKRLVEQIIYVAFLKGKLEP